jgi:hypothetical protein
MRNRHFAMTCEKLERENCESALLTGTVHGFSGGITPTHAEEENCKSNGNRSACRGFSELLSDGVSAKLDFFAKRM